MRRQLSIYLEEGLIEWIKFIAINEKRSLSKMLEIILTKLKNKED
jgi:hypothetical protein